MRVRCRATADYRSNAIGLLELECVPDGLRIALTGVSSYREGYAPGPPAHAADVTVPWSSVYATQLGAEALLLSVEARFLPQNRFLLRDFAERRSEANARSPRQRALALLAVVAGLLGLGLALEAMNALPHPDVFGTFGLAVLVVTLVVVGLHHTRRAPAPSSDEVLAELSRELSAHLPNHVPIEPPSPPPRRFVLRELAALLPRSAVGISITLAAASLAALVGSSAARPDLHAASPSSADVSALGSSGGAAQGVNHTPEATRNDLEDAPAAEADPLARPTFGDTCRCQRDESLAWRAPLPRLSPLVLASRSSLHDGHRHFELELALINNSAEPATRIDLSVVFFEELGGGQQGQRQSGERPLYFEGPLLPGRLIKWHVEGRGTSFDVVGPNVGKLAEDGHDTARGEAWDSLASAASRPVRLHTMRVLAFIGDPRLQMLAASLRQGASESELGLLDRLARTPPPVATCQLDVQHQGGAEWRVNACLDNDSDEPRSRLALRLLAYDAPLSPDLAGARLPEILAEHTTPLRETLAARSGRRVTLTASFPLEEAVVPRAFEVLVDREEYLR
jgi:hypothetical protein